MCSHDEYNYFPSVTIGGPPGNYILRPPVPSYQNIEFCVVSYVCGLAGPGNALVSGSEPTNTIDLTATSTFNDNAFLRGQFYRAGTNGSMTPTETWERITHPQGNIFVLIVGSTTSYLTIRFREKILNRIPAPATTVHPSQEHLTHKERERRIEQAVLGTEGELETHGKRPARPGTVRSLQTGGKPGTADYQSEYFRSNRG